MCPANGGKAKAKGSSVSAMYPRVTFTRQRPPCHTNHTLRP